MEDPYRQKLFFHYCLITHNDSNGIRSHNHLVCKRTLNHLAKLAK